MFSCIYKFDFFLNTTQQRILVLAVFSFLKFTSCDCRERCSWENIKKIPDGKDKKCVGCILAPITSYSITKTSELQYAVRTNDEVPGAEYGSGNFHIRHH